MRRSAFSSALVLALALASSSLVSAQRFFPDDPLWEEPPPRPSYGLEPRDFSEILDALSNFTGNPGERHPAIGVIPAGGINTLGEVMDGPWYVNRHGRRRMSQEALLEGSGTKNPPAFDRPWSALLVKPFGLRPGILIRDSKNDVYLLRFDPPGHREVATGAEMVSSRIFHALGYHVPQTYLVEFDRSRLVASEAGEGISSAGARRDLTEEDIDTFLGYTEAQRGHYRAVATFAGREMKGLIGPYQVFGLRSDDPNDIVPHEHRRDLRGLFVFSAWLNHNYMRAMNTIDVVVESEGVPYVRHWLVDFANTLGSGGLAGVKPAWEGNETIYPRRDTLTNMIGLGIYTPRWMRERYPRLDAVGRFGYQSFDPERWTTVHDIAPFANRLPDDEFWATKQVLAFSDEDLRTLVSAGQYSDPKVADWLVKCLVERRNRIGRTYLEKVLPLDDFRVDDGRLGFEDLKVTYGLAPEREYPVRWLELDNDVDVLTLITGAQGLELPRTASSAPAGTYYAARVSGDDPEMHVTAYIRKEDSGDYVVVGVDRSWPGKVIADPANDLDTGKSRYADLAAEPRALFDDYAKDYATRRGREITSQEYFDSLTISERTTFDAITHALMSSELTDEAGNSLGRAFDLVAGVERIAGQYYGRGGDQQFRLYVHLVPGTKETLERSREFYFGHENTIYHVGYPMSFRQDGKEPTMQFSISEDEQRADIDVDYRSSKSPQALFNGHLTSANSDVRSGNNLELHNGRWQGFIGWWQEVFGTLSTSDDRPSRDLLAAEVSEPPSVLPPDRAPGTPIDAIHDAVQEFLTDWLVRRQYDDALDVLSPQVYACLNLDDDVREEALDASSARRELATLMRYSVEELGDRDNLTEAIDAVAPWDPDRPVVSHPFESDFMLTLMTELDARQYLCGQQPQEPTGVEYYGVLFRFKKRGAAVLGLLWSRETGSATWRIASYRSSQQ